MFVVAQISDLHFDGTTDRRKRVAAVMDYLNGRCGGPRHIDALLVTGDIADEGLPEEYREAVDALSTDIPMLMTLGNHDDRAAFNSVVHDARAPGEPVNSALRLDGLLIVLLDSSISGRSDGYLARGTLDWASARIAEAGATIPVLVGFHHPALPVGIPFIDDRCQRDPTLLAEFIAAHPNIVGTVAGHAHSPAVTTFAGRPHAIAPGVASALNLPFEGSDIINTVQRPGVAFHFIDDGRLTTHFRGIPS